MLRRMFSELRGRETSSWSHSCCSTHPGFGEDHAVEAGEVPAHPRTQTLGPSAATPRACSESTRRTHSLRRRQEGALVPILFGLRTPGNIQNPGDRNNIERPSFLSETTICIFISSIHSLIPKSIGQWRFTHCKFNKKNS